MIRRTIRERTRLKVGYKYQEEEDAQDMFLLTGKDKTDFVALCREMGWNKSDLYRAMVRRVVREKSIKWLMK